MLGRKKAFIHVVEIVIISLVVFVLVMQFAIIPNTASDWSRAKLSTMGDDILSSMGGWLDVRGFSWLDTQNVAQEMDRLLSGTNIVYSLDVTGVIKPNIAVGCLCSAEELDSIRDSLNDTKRAFSINGQETRFWVEPLDPGSPEFPEWYDVIILTGGIDLDTEADGIDNYLAGGGGLVLYEDLDENRLTPTVIRVFGLAWNDLARTGALNFSGGTDSRYYSLQKYFHHIPDYSGALFGWDYQFPNFIRSGFTEELITAAGGSEALLESPGKASGLVAMEMDNGRTAWLSRGLDSLDPGAGNVLLKSVMAWTAGDTKQVVPGNVMEPAISRTTGAVNKDMFQPLEIVLKMGYVF